ncbi:MAG: NADH-quinone oxidoreductase subunit NuoK [Chloroflexi bacterium]|nr:NADH-quinone oxidoreductase subunit NuoK [Chloroflexota bacterium]
MVPVAYLLGLSAIMFVIGMVGVLVRRNALVVFMSLELMFNAANLVFVTFAAYYQTLVGQLSVFFVMTVAAAEVGVGLALMVEIFRTKHSIDIDQLSNLKG